MDQHNKRDQKFYKWQKFEGQKPYKWQKFVALLYFCIQASHICLTSFFLSILENLLSALFYYIFLLYKSWFVLSIRKERLALGLLSRTFDKRTVPFVTCWSDRAKSSVRQTFYSQFVYFNPMLLYLILLVWPELFSFKIV